MSSRCSDGHQCQGLYPRARGTRDAPRHATRRSVPVLVFSQSVGRPDGPRATGEAWTDPRDRTGAVDTAAASSLA
jgi:hypothetical protein